MAIPFAIAAFAAGTYSAYKKREGLYGNANERDRAAKESLLTAKYNIKQRTIEGRQTQFQVLETGGNLVRQIAIEGKRAEGAATVAGATSGAVVESGSSRAVLANIAQEAVSAQTDAIIATKNRIRAEARDITNKNTSEWRNAKLNQRQQNRIAKRERKSADKQFTADMLKTGVSTIGAYNTASAFSKKTDTTKTVAKSKGMGETARSSTIPKTRIPTQGRPSKDYSTASLYSTKKYGIGANPPQGPGDYKVTGWGWKKYTKVKGWMRRKGHGDIWRKSRRKGESIY